MPKIDMNAYNEAEVSTSVGGLVPGGYVARITAIRTSGTNRSGDYIDYVNEKQYVKVVYDIAEGEYAGIYSDPFWTPEDMDYGHCFYLSWKNLSMLKGNMEALEDSNPGFDPMSAFSADAWGMFIGRQIGLVFGDEEYESSDGEVKTRLRLPNLKPVADIRSGNFKVPRTKKLDGGKPAAKKAAAVSDDDIPFK